MTEARGRRRAARGLGSVALVGAGPGDPELITLRGMILLRGADVVVYDRLVSQRTLTFASPTAEMIDVGKAPGRHRTSQDEISTILVREARAGKTVVRLKGGDPFVFGRGGEEAEVLARAGIPVEIVPGVTSAIAGPGAAGIPVTHRDAAATIGIATAHEASGKAGARVDWRALARLDTVVLLMGVERLEAVTRALLDAGRASDTPAAVVQEATLPTQRTVTATLATIADEAARAGIRAPAVTVVGDVVRARSLLGGRDTRPLSGVRVLVTRTREQAGELSRILHELGADVIEAPAIRVVAPRSPDPMRRAVERLRDARYEWLVLTSANGVRALSATLWEMGSDVRALGRTRIAAVGTGTERALMEAGLRADLVPATFTTEAIGRAFPEGDGRVLLARADKVEPVLQEALVVKGWRVDTVVAYRLVGGNRLDPSVRRAILDGGVDVVAFASGGTVRSFAALLRAPLPASIRVACIGPVTAKAARDAGMRVDAVADPHTIPALAAAVVEAAGRADATRG